MIHTGEPTLPMFNFGMRGVVTEREYEGTKKQSPPTPHHLYEGTKKQSLGKSVSRSFSNVHRTGRSCSQCGARGQAMPQYEGNTKASDL